VKPDMVALSMGVGQMWPSPFVSTRLHVGTRTGVSDGQKACLAHPPCGGKKRGSHHTHIRTSFRLAIALTLWQSFLWSSFPTRCIFRVMSANLRS
jgi:hypothetical protein